MLVATKVVSLVGMLAVDSLTAAVATRAVRALVARTRVALAMVALGVVSGLILADRVIVAYLLTRVDAGPVVVRFLEGLRYSALVTGVSNSTAIAVSTRVLG